jgi:hypothetical protein
MGWASLLASETPWGLDMSLMHSAIGQAQQWPVGGLKSEEGKFLKGLVLVLYNIYLCRYEQCLFPSFACPSAALKSELLYSFASRVSSFHRVS